MDIEQAMRAMAPLTVEEERLALGLEDAPWPPPLTAADRVEARGVRFAAWISDAEWRALGARERRVDHEGPVNQPVSNRLTPDVAGGLQPRRACMTARCADGALACATTNRRIS